MSLTPIAERNAVRLSLSVFMTKVCRGWNTKAQHSAFGMNTSLINQVRHHRDKGMVNQVNKTKELNEKIKQEAHGPHCSPEKTVQIYKHICLS